MSVKKIQFALFLVIWSISIVTIIPKVAHAQGIIVPEVKPYGFGGSDTPQFQLNHEIFDTTSVPFEIHVDQDNPKSYGNWLGLNVPYEPAKDIWKQIEAQTHTTLQNRQEAHITVITPPEFVEILQPAGITMAEINEIAKQMRIQESKYDIYCLGRKRKLKAGEMYVVYSIIVKSQDLIDIRRAIFELYTRKGGEPSQFNPDSFSPHITVAYTKSDLFEGDGIFKSTNSCWGIIELRSYTPVEN